MLRFTKPMRMAVGCTAAAAFGIVATPAFAALSLADVDWNSYLDWNAFTDWHSWLLVGSLALFIVGLLLKAERPALSADLENGAKGERYTRRIRAMPVEFATGASRSMFFSKDRKHAIEKR